MKLFQKWIAIHDIFNTTEHVFKRLPNKKPFYSIDDERLVWLEKTFVEYINGWKKEVDRGARKMDE